MKCELIEHGQNDMLSYSVIIGGQLNFATDEEMFIVCDQNSQKKWLRKLLTDYVRILAAAGVIIARWKEGAHHELSAVEMDGRGIAAAAAAAIISYRSMRETDEKRVQSLRTSQSTQLLS